MNKQTRVTNVFDGEIELQLQTMEAAEMMFDTVQYTCEKDDNMLCVAHAIKMRLYELDLAESYLDGYINGLVRLLCLQCLEKQFLQHGSSLTLFNKVGVCIDALRDVTYSSVYIPRKHRYTGDYMLEIEMRGAVGGK